MYRCFTQFWRGQSQTASVLSSSTPRLRANKVDIWLEPIDLWPETFEHRSEGIADQPRQIQGENEENRG